jgi:hypothetical protein
VSRSLREISYFTKSRFGQFRYWDLDEYQRAAQTVRTAVKFSAETTRFACRNDSAKLSLSTRNLRFPVDLPPRGQ